MDILIKFILSAAGLSWILTKAIIFKRLREAISRKHIKYKEPKPYDREFDERRYFWWFIDEVMNCSGCMGFWAGIVFHPTHFPPTILGYLASGCVGAISARILINLSEKLKK